MSFNFDLAGALVGGVRDDTPGLIQMTLCEVAELYPPHALDATFLTNHDMIRVMTVHAAKGLEAPVVILPDIAIAAVQNARRAVGKR